MFCGMWLFKSRAGYILRLKSRWWPSGPRADGRGHVWSRFENPEVSTRETDFFTRSWAGGRCVRFATGKSGFRLLAVAYQEYVNWHCNLLIRRRLCGRAVETTHKAKNNETDLNTQSWLYNTIAVVKRHQNTISKKNIFTVPNFARRR